MRDPTQPISWTEQCRYALNCDNVKPPAAGLNAPCPYCRSPWSLHATKGNTITDVGFIRGDHPAWVAMLELISKEGTNVEIQDHPAK